MEPTIRLARDDDGPALARIYAMSIIDTPISFELAPPDAAEMTARSQQVLGYAPWLVYDAGGVRGYAYASRHNDRAAYRWAVNFSVYVDAAHRREGVARALYTSLLALVRLQGFYTAHAGITVPNPGSQMLHERFGFVSTGTYRAVGFKCGAWHDVCWWQLTLRERDGAPAEPRTPAELAADPRWRDALASGLAGRRVSSLHYI